MALSWAELAAQASDEAVAVARTVLEQDVADHAWARQIGPALNQRDTARLLGRSEQARFQRRAPPPAPQPRRTSRLSRLPVRRTSPPARHRRGGPDLVGCRGAPNCRVLAH